MPHCSGAAILESREHLLPWMPWAANEPVELSQRVQWLRKCRGKFDLDQDYIYGVFNLDETKVLGGTGLHTRAGEAAREIGYWIHKDYHPPGTGDRIVRRPDPGRLRGRPGQPGGDPLRPRQRLQRSRAAQAGLHLRRHPARPLAQQRWLTQRLDDLDHAPGRIPGSPCASAQIEAYNAIGQRLL